MADVFLSYRNTPLRRSYVERLRLVLDAYGITAWWDYGLEAGLEFEPQIMAELEKANLVVPLWCEESVLSEWVAKEAAHGLKRNKLMPARLQSVPPPLDFGHIQSQDLVQWQGTADGYQVIALAHAINQRIGRDFSPQSDKLRALTSLPALNPLNHVDASDPFSRSENSASESGHNRVPDFGLGADDLSKYPQFKMMYELALSAQAKARVVAREADQAVMRAHFASKQDSNRMSYGTDDEKWTGVFDGGVGFGVYEQRQDSGREVTILGTFKDLLPTVGKFITGSIDQEFTAGVPRVRSRFDDNGRPIGHSVLEFAIFRFEGEASLGFPCGYSVVFVDGDRAIMAGEIDAGPLVSGKLQPDTPADVFLSIFPRGFMIVRPDERILGLYVKSGQDFKTVYAANGEYDFKNAGLWDFELAGPDLRTPATHKGS